MKKIFFIFLMLLSSLALARWPTEPVTIIVPAPAGGLSDVMARSMQPELEKYLGVPIIVRNIPGGNYLIAARHITTNPNDNHTFLMNDAIWAASTYFLDTDTINQFKTINMFAQSPMCLGSRAGITREAFLKTSKNKAQANVAVNGINSVHYRWLNNAGTGIKWTEIPYTGAAPIIAAVAGDQVDYSVLSIGGYKPMMDAGKIRCQMVSTIKRNPAFPDVPTFQELGFKGDPGYQWWGFVTREDTKDEAVQKFSSAVERVIKDGHSVESIAKTGVVFKYVPENKAKEIFNKEVIKFSK